MPVIHFDLVCPDVAERETTAFCINNDREIPDGEYGFIEMYCDNPKCDCKEAIIEVYETSISTPLATILYRFGASAENKSRTCLCALCRYGLELEADGNQSAIAEPLMRLFARCLGERDYERTILRHYKLFKAAVSGKNNKHRQKHKTVGSFSVTK